MKLRLKSEKTEAEAPAAPSAAAAPAHEAPAAVSPANEAPAAALAGASDAISILYSQYSLSHRYCVTCIQDLLVRL